MTAANVDITTCLASDGQTLDIFLRHPDETGRFEAEAVLVAMGAGAVVYPGETDPLPVDGLVAVADAGITVQIGPIYIISPLEVRADVVARARRARLFVLVDDWSPTENTEKKLTAALLPLRHLEREET